MHQLIGNYGIEEDTLPLTSLLFSTHRNQKPQNAIDATLRSIKRILQFFGKIVVNAPIVVNL